MSRGVLIVVVLVVVGAVGGSAASGAGSPEPVLKKPRVTLGPLFPLTVRGTQFKPGETVTVTLDGGRRGTRKVRATRAGGFTATFPMRLNRCATVTVRAVGSAGSRVTYQPPRPNCREP